MGLLLDAGRVSAEDMRRAVWEGDYGVLPPALRRAAGEAVEVLSATGDPQLADFLLDRAYYAEMVSAAEDTGSEFLIMIIILDLEHVHHRLVRDEAVQVLKQLLLLLGHREEMAAEIAGILFS